MIARTKEVLRAGFFKWPLSDKLQTNIYRPREVFKVVDIACQPLFARDPACRTARAEQKKTCHTAPAPLIRSLRVPHS